MASIMYETVQNRLTKTLVTGKTTEYYFVCKMSGSIWHIVNDPFILKGDCTTGVSGEFISSSWFKSEIPHNRHVECAIISMTTNTNDIRHRHKSRIERLQDIVKMMNKIESVWALDNIVLYHKFDNKYLCEVTKQLEEKLIKNNSDIATFHGLLNNEVGTFGMSFTKRKDENPYMYCPSFTLYSP